MIKKYIINKSMNSIKKMFPEYDEIKLEEIKYGLEALYLSVTKLVVILIICLIIGIFKEAVLLLIFFNILRTTGFGLHASKSWICWVSSSLVFIGIPFLIKYINIPVIILYITAIISFISLAIFAPADTINRPLINKKKRKIYKIITIIISLVYLIIILIEKNNYWTNILSFSLLIESCLTNPLTYKIFHLPYNNYKNYKGI